MDEYDGKDKDITYRQKQDYGYNVEEAFFRLKLAEEDLKGELEAIAESGKIGRAEMDLEILI